MEIGIGLFSLGDLAYLYRLPIRPCGNAGVLVNIHHLAFGVGAAGDDDDPLVIPTVAGMGDHDGTIDRRVFTYAQGRTCQRSCRKKKNR